MKPPDLLQSGEDTPTLLPLALVCAMSREGVIGRAGQLPWHLPEDLKHFRTVTLGHAVIMGRSTYASLGRPLPHRRNLVLTRDRDAQLAGVEVVHSFYEAIQLARTTDTEPRVIGGAQVYALALPVATRMLLTEVLQSVEGDVHFPPFDRSLWQEQEVHYGEGLVFRDWTRKPTRLAILPEVHTPLEHL